MSANTDNTVLGNTGTANIYTDINNLFQQFEHGLQGMANGPIHAIRRKAFKAFNDSGFPTSKNEEWKYTAMGNLVKGHFEFSLQTKTSHIAPTDIRKVHVEGLKANVMVFINGQYLPHGSTVITPVHEMEVMNFASAESKRVDAFHEHFAQYAKVDSDAFTALNTAFAAQGTFIHVPEENRVEIPVVLHFINDCTNEKAVSQPRNLIVVGKNSHVKVIETFSTIGDFAGFSNAVTEVFLAEGASIEYYKLGNEGDKSSHVGTTHVYQSAGSRSKTVTITTSGNMVRNNLYFSIDGEGAEANMYGLYLGKGKTLIDNHTTADHLKPNTESNELYKGVMAGNSTGVFNGKIFVREDAQKTNAFQSNRSILIGKDANVNTKPQLEIFADDVKCSHGATIGALDEEPLFYLRSRGLNESDARAMLLHAFISDVFNQIEIPQVKVLMENLANDYLNTIKG